MKPAPKKSSGSLVKRINIRESGFVNGIDIITISGKPVRCLAFISERPDGRGSTIQVATEVFALQSILELAWATGVELKVYYSQTGGAAILTRASFKRTSFPKKTPTCKSPGKRDI